MIPTPPQIKLSGNTQNLESCIPFDQGLKQQNRQPNQTLVGPHSGDSGFKIPNSVSKEGVPEPETTRVTTSQVPCSCNKELNTKFDIFSKAVLRNMSSLKANMLQLREDMQVVINQKVDQIADNPENFFQRFEFPVKEEQTLVDVNNYLQDDMQFKQAVHQMTKLGGKDIYDFIRRCFQETFSDCLSRHYTYDGTKNKLMFKNQKLCLLFIAAAQQHNGADHRSIQEAIRKWLRRANERFNYRK